MCITATNTIKLTMLKKRAALWGFCRGELCSPVCLHPRGRWILRSKRRKESARTSICIKSLFYALSLSPRCHSDSSLPKGALHFLPLHSYFEQSLSQLRRPFPLRGSLVFGVRFSVYKKRFRDTSEPFLFYFFIEIAFFAFSTMFTARRPNWSRSFTAGPE